MCKTCIQKLKTLVRKIKKFYAKQRDMPGLCIGRLKAVKIPKFPKLTY